MTFDIALAIVRAVNGDKNGNNYLKEKAMDLMKNYNKRFSKKNNGKH